MATCSFLGSLSVTVAFFSRLKLIINKTYIVKILEGNIKHYFDSNALAMVVKSKKDLTFL